MLVSDSWPEVKCGKPRPPGSLLGKNKHWELFANVIWLWSAQQLGWVYAIHKYMSTWGRFTASEPGARLAWEWEADWLSTCWDRACACVSVWKYMCTTCLWQWTCVRVSERVCGWRDVCTCSWTTCVCAENFHSQQLCAFHCVYRYMWICDCTYLSCLESQAVGVTVVLWAGTELTAH